MLKTRQSRLCSDNAIHFVSMILKLIVMSWLITPVICFASWLECYVDLLDSTEVIMNMRIQKYEDITYEPYKSVKIEYQYEGTNEWIVSSSESKVIYLPNAITTLKLRLHVPDDLLSRGIHQIQYVLDLVSMNGCNKDTNYKEYGTCLTTKFNNPIMCQGKRSHSIDYKTPVTIQIDDTISTNNTTKQQQQSISDTLMYYYNVLTASKKNNDIIILAGWAAGREAVKITQPLVLHRGSMTDKPPIDTKNSNTNEL
jgi:hypothetical protein